MSATFYFMAAVAVISTVLVITHTNAVHALLYLIVSLLAVALIFFALGAPFIAALELIIYAGAIMVLFIFVMMILNLGEAATQQERRWLNPRLWVGPAILTIVLLAELVVTLSNTSPLAGGSVVGPKQVGMLMFGPYLLGVELASILLLAGLVGAYHLARRDTHRERGEKPA
ncbi:MAG: NADH-quinone oxidoreductase subunit J [Anaerolineales bacterium]|nr:NADH-quinone oxidoreductase subunit J [Anaerolineales bacterium]